MTILGQMKRARVLGYKVPRGKNGYNYIWHACIDCGKERWVCLRRGEPESKRCRACALKGNLITYAAGEKNPNWKGGRYKSSDGYILVKLQPNDFFYSMADHDGYVLEHRLIVAQHLGRCLLPWEVVHHKNAIRNDNRLENLIIFDTPNEHTLFEHEIWRRANQEVSDGREYIRKSS